MSIKIFKPQLKSDKWLNFGNKFVIIYSLFFFILVFLIFYYIEHANILFSIGISFFILIFTCAYGKFIQNQLKKWDFGGYTTLEINTEGRIRLDKDVKIYANQINYVSIIEDEPPTPIGFHTYYSIVNVIMRFNLNDGSTVDFYVQNATELIKIINLLRSMSVNVVDSEVEMKHKDDIKLFWVLMSIIAMAVLFIIFGAIYNN